MNTEDLMKPRYKVIGLYPATQFAIGEIVELDINNNVYRSGKSILEHNFPSIWDCPAIFRKLEWWEERKIEDMPEYVSRLVNGSKVVIKCPGKSFLDDGYFKWQFGAYPRKDFLPSTETEYLNQKN